MEASAELELAGPAGTKRALYFGAAGHELFGWYHRPAAGRFRDAAVVLVNPLGTDFTRSDRVYRHLAEELAAAGFPVLRYDMFATGDSAGEEPAPALVRHWLDDIGRAGAEVRARSGASKLVLVGLRLGGTLAMAHAAERSGTVDSLVLWSPCVSGKAFVTEAVKMDKLYRRLDPLLADAAPPAADGEEALGVFLSRSTVDDLGKVDLLTTTERPAARTLFIDGGMVAGRDAMLAHLGKLGAEPELRAHPGHKFLITISHRGLLPTDVLTSIGSWLAERYPDVPAPAGPPPGPATVLSGPSGERPLVFGQRPLFGIFTPRAAGLDRPAPPPIVLTNAGCVNRSGPHRLYARMARRWSALGFDVLRVDLSGIGDSPAAPDTDENVTYPPSGLDDLAQAIDALGVKANERVVIAGLCSGGDYAFQLGTRDRRVATAVIMNPRTFCMLDLKAVESSSSEPPGPTVASVPAALRSMVDATVDTLLVVSLRDPGIAYVDTHYAGEMRALGSAAGFVRIDIRGADHTFTPVGSQDRVLEAVTAHLARRYGARAGA
ncbi:MAG TPA: alpha/beta hydrolase [Polyangia bacterium]|nr:alpha/beta hydrolase [Polyangia bacterium]